MSGFNINLIFSNNLNRKVGFAFEPGFIYNATDFNSNNLKLILNKIDLPIFINFSINKKLYLSIGTDIYVEMCSKNKYASNEYLNTTSMFEIGGLLGANFKITETLSLGLKYTYTINPVFKTSYFNNSGVIVKETKFYGQFLQLSFKKDLFVQLKNINQRLQ